MHQHFYFQTPKANLRSEYNHCALPRLTANWRYNKEKKTPYLKLKTKGSKKALEDKLKKVEADIEVYKEELKRAKAEKEKIQNKIKKNERKFRHCELMNWVVGFINKINEECDEVRGGVKIENRENLGQCHNQA